MYCEKCKVFHHELPDCIIPYKRYCADVIENIVNEQTSDICSDNAARRIRGWWDAIKPYFLFILRTLEAKFGKQGVSFGNAPAFREIVRAVANSNNWTFAHKVCTHSESRRE